MSALEEIKEELTLGLDIGIGSCGWAMIAGEEGSGRIVALGVRTFDVPETSKKRTPTNQIRRENRLLRRGTRRRRQRMAAIRILLKTHGLIASDAKDSLHVAGLDPWQLRADALKRQLRPVELAVVLGHIAKHRGFKSNSKRDRGQNAPDDQSKMLAAIERTRERLGQYRTVGQMFAKDEEYSARKRNRDGDYTRSILRDDQRHEVDLIFDEQRRLHNAQATPALLDSFKAIAFFQRPLADSEHLVGPCPFEAGERRAAKNSYSFELFRVLSRLAAIRLSSGRTERALSAEEIGAAAADFGRPGFKLTYKNLRKIAGIGEEWRFDVSAADESHDIASRKGDSAFGTKTIRKLLGDAWKTLLAHPEKIDRIGDVLTFRESPESIRKGLESIGLDPLIVDALMAGVSNGEFSSFRGAAHISAKAVRAIIPFLQQGLVYSEACAKAGYDHTRRAENGLAAIANPVAKKVVRETMKQVRAITAHYGLPGRIHIELARDVGKSQEERDEIRFGIEKRNKAKDRLREEFLTTVGKAVQNAEDLMRFELWKEQNGRCLYTDKEIHPDQIVSSDRSVEVDHILPWSRSGDDSFVNKTLCFASANQAKKGRTPFEWLGGDAAAWDSFVARVESIKGMKGRKKRNYTLKDAKVLEEKFRPRNLNDTRYAARIVADMLRGLYSADGKRRVFARPGPLTDRLRRAWGIQGLKKDDDGKRVPDDRHHALDALIVAAMGEGALNRLTRAAQLEEARGSSRFISNFDAPWSDFKQEAMERYEDIFVSRAERRRARGEAHAATVRSVRTEANGTVVYERKAVEKLTKDDLSRIKDPQRNAKLIESLSEWIAAGKPKGKPPLSPKGDPVRKLSVATNKKMDVAVRGGAADRGEMVRVDVYRKKTARAAWEYFIVPIYPHQVADANKWPTPPNMAISAFKDEAEWIAMTQDHEFVWSLYPFSYIEIEKPDGTTVEGYYRGTHRGTGAITISDHRSNSMLTEGLGARRLRSFRKYAVDRLGRRFEVLSELRTWHGAVCT